MKDSLHYLVRCEVCNWQSRKSVRLNDARRIRDGHRMEQANCEGGKLYELLIEDNEVHLILMGSENV
jgi:hypothetical protein